MRGALSKEIENGSKTSLDSGLSWFFVFGGMKMKCVAERISGGGPPWAHEAGGHA